MPGSPYPQPSSKTCLLLNVNRPSRISSLSTFTRSIELSQHFKGPSPFDVTISNLDSPAISTTLTFPLNIFMPCISMFSPAYLYE
uniref:Uncharacterized protein n=1 Tax=Arundo donax TaxID=35708 RepID=A0A0A9D0H9_ARUDO